MQSNFRHLRLLYKLYQTQRKPIPVNRRYEKSQYDKHILKTFPKKAIPALGRLRLEDHMFEASLDHDSRKQIIARGVGARL